MNQILYNKDDDELNKSKNLFKNNIFRIQFIVSCSLTLTVIFSYFIYSYNKESKEDLSKKIMQSYNISKLYNDDENNSSTYEQDGTKFTILGIIEIPTLGISYPILSECNDDLLKIAPCKFSGSNPNEDGNLCIAAHNYDNYKFFSKISSLSNRKSYFYL